MQVFQSPFGYNAKNSPLLKKVKAQFNDSSTSCACPSQVSAKEATLEQGEHHRERLAQATIPQPASIKLPRHLILPFFLSHMRKYKVPGPSLMDRSGIWSLNLAELSIKSFHCYKSSSVCPTPLIWLPESPRCERIKMNSLITPSPLQTNRKYLQERAGRERNVGKGESCIAMDRSPTPLVEDCREEASTWCKCTKS